MTIRVEACRRPFTEEVQHKVTEATFTVVTIDGNRKPRLVPPPADPAQEAPSKSPGRFDLYRGLGGMYRRVAETTTSRNGD
jgi:acyl-CoA hydrolase